MCRFISLIPKQKKFLSTPYSGLIVKRREPERWERDERDERERERERERDMRDVEDGRHNYRLSKIDRIFINIVWY